MEICICVALIAVVLCELGLAPFECGLGLILLTPICAYPLGMLMGAGPLRYGCAFVFLLAVLLILTRGRARYVRAESRDALLPIGYFILCFSLFSYFCHLWPDFYQLGERLRDFAVLSAVINSPIEAREPWLAGYPLNYYLYWYRFGHMLDSVLKLPIWEVYHQLQAFTFALFTTSTFVLFKKYAKFPLWGAFASSILISLGSNAEGVYFFIKNDPNWWGPSRVIPGAINEFPAWSFLLGDVHPHYLNLGLIPFLCSAFLGLVATKAQASMKLLSVFGILAVGTLWIYNANAWEVPVWMGLSCACFFIFLISVPLPVVTEYFRTKIQSKDFLTPASLLLSASIAYLCYCLALSSLNIVPAHMPLKLVEAPIPRSTSFDLLRHWGIPLCMIGLATLFTIGKIEWVMCAILALGLATFSRSALALLAVLFLISAISIWRRRNPSSQPDMTRVVFSAMGVVALLLIIFPELFFLDDSYGGENERMNTIFKAYSASWFLLHGFALYALTQIPRGWLKPFAEIPAKPLVIVITILWCGFFFRTVKLRKSIEGSTRPVAQGLSDVERRFPGSATTIQILANSRPGVVLEAQGPAYDFTAHVATLSSQTSYLGWANHINLLLQVYPEVDRRSKLTEAFYRETDCSKKREMINQEHINYIVLGPLEKKAFPEASAENFGCFRELVRSKEYLVFEN